MRILHVISSLSPRSGGPTTVVLSLSQEQARQGHEVVICTTNADNPCGTLPVQTDCPISNKKVTIWYFSIHRFIPLCFSKTLTHWMNNKIGSFDIVHIHGIGRELSLSILDAIKDFDIPIVQTVHDYGLLCPNTNFISKGDICERCKSHRYYNVVLRRCKRENLPASLLAGIETYFHYWKKTSERNVDIFISPSKFLKNKLREFGIRNRIVHIPNFINSVDLRPNYSPGEYLLFSGRLTAIKGITTLLKSMKSIKETRLNIAGDGELNESLQKLANKNNLSNIKFLGHLETSELYSQIKKASFVVVPSESYENYPMTIIEAFACGKPVLASNLGAIPDIVKDGFNGLLFEPKNVHQLTQKIRFLINNPQKIEDMGRNARNQVEKINNPEYHYQQTAKIYDSLIQNH